MQHTDMYNLNQPEMDDTFSTQPLNDNARSTESTTYLGEIAAKAEIAARQALEGRVAALEVFGSAGNGSTTANLGFTPLLLYVTGMNGAIWIHKDYHPYSGLYIVEGGFHHDGAYASCGYVAFV